MSRAAHKRLMKRVNNFFVEVLKGLSIVCSMKLFLAALLSLSYVIDDFCFAHSIGGQPFIPSFVRPFGGDLAGNGGGIVEQNFQFVHVNLPRILTICLNSTQCVSNEEAKVLSKILQSFPNELKTKPGLVFESGAANPTRFIVHGQPRVAVTGDRVGDPIYLNLDILYGLTSAGKVEVAGVGTAIAILIHELAHHQGKYQSQEDERFLDLLGAKVRAYLASEMEIMKADSWGEIPEHTPARIEMLALHSEATALDRFYDGPQTSLLLSDGHQSFPLDAEISQQLHCPLKSGHSGKVLGYRFHGMRWDQWKYATSTSFRRIYLFHAPAFLQCLYPKDDLQGTIYTNLEVVLTLAFDEPRSGSGYSNYEYVQESLRLALVPQ
ncbi:MAG: hypothetical protein JNM39_04435 [Bdellovibrionaceae bacterium]|nr:hypothetical protein [Pseudobdellovibrionaceae bacterium]